MMGANQTNGGTFKGNLIYSMNSSNISNISNSSNSSNSTRHDYRATDGAILIVAAALAIDALTMQ